MKATVSARQLWVHSLREGDVIAVRVGDHHGLDFVVRTFCGSCRCSGVEMGDLFL